MELSVQFDPYYSSIFELDSTAVFKEGLTTNSGLDKSMVGRHGVPGRWSA